MGQHPPFPSSPSSCALIMDPPRRDEIQCVRKLLENRTDFTTPIFKDFSEAHWGWRAYAAMQFKIPSNPLSDIPRSPEHLQACVAMIVDAVRDASRTDTRLPKDTQEDALRFLLSLRPFEVHMIAWKLLQSTIQAQQGACFRTSWGKYPLAIEEFKTFQERFHALITALKTSKYLCRAIFGTQLPLIHIIALNPTLEAFRGDRYTLWQAQSDDSVPSSSKRPRTGYSADVQFSNRPSTHSSDHSSDVVSSNWLPRNIFSYD